MKLLGLIIKNFQNHSDTVIAFDNVLDIFQGANEAGKTAILNAIKFLFTDKCRDVIMVKDHPVLIKHGEHTAEVACKFEHDGTEYQIKKTIEHNKSGAIFYKDGEIVAIKPNDVRAEILKVLGITEAMLGFLFDAFDLSKVTPAELKKTLQGLFTSSDPEILRQYLIDSGFKDMDGTPFMDTILKLYSSGGVEAASKYAIDNRVKYKRELKETKEPEKPLLYPSKDEVEIAKTTLSASQESRNSFAGEMKNNARRTESLKAEITRLSESDRPRKPEKPTDTLISIAQIQKDADNAASASETARTTLNEWRENNQGADIGDLPNMAEYLKGMGDRISTQSLKAVKDEISQKSADIERINAEGVSLTDTYNDAHGKEMDADKVLVDAVNSNEKAQSAIDGYETVLKNWQTSIDEIEKSIGDKSQELSTLKESLKGRTVGDLDKTIGELDLEISDMNGVISAATLMGNYETRIEEIAKIKGLLQKKITNWDNICKALDPKNEKLTALFSSGKESFDEMFRKINADLGLEVTLRSDYTFMAKEYGSSDAMRRVSPSRQLRIGAALLIAICHQIGWKTVMIDWLDALYGMAKEDMIKVLLGLEEYEINTLAFGAGPVEYKGDFRPDWENFVRPVIDGSVVAL